MVIQVETPETQMAQFAPKVEAPAAQEKPEQKESTESVTEEKEVEKPESEEVESTEAKTKEDETEEESEEEKSDKPRKKGGFQRRIDKLNAKISEREKELEYWRSVALKEKQETKPEQAQESHKEGKPNPDNFDTHADYVEALTDWKVEQKEKERLDSERKAKEKESFESTQKVYREKVQAFAEKQADFYDVIEEIQDVPTSMTFQAGILNSEYGPQLMYALAKDPTEYARVARLEPIACAMALGRLEASLVETKEKQKEIKKITKAPNPLTPLGGGKSAVVKSPDEMSQKEYEAWRRKQQEKETA